MTDDIVARARAALEGVTPERWQYWDDFVGRRSVDLGRRSDGEFVAQSPELVAELADEVERLRADYAELEAVPGPGFDEWLSEHDREVAARTLRDAADELGTDQADDERWIASCLGYYGEDAWMRDRADMIERGEDV